MNDLDSLQIIGYTAPAVLGYLIPTIIAFWRYHHFRWVIFGINLLLGFTGFAWLFTFLWAIWPKNTKVFGQEIMGPEVYIPKKNFSVPYEYTVNLTVAEVMSLLDGLYLQYKFGDITKEELSKRKTNLLKALKK